MLKQTFIAALACGGLWIGVQDSQARQRKRPVPQQQLLNRLNNLNLNNDRAIQRGGWNGLNNRGYGQPPANLKGFDGQLTAGAVSTAIDDAVLFLKRAQAEDGGIGENHYARGGPTGLAALAMLAAGVHPVSDPQLARALEWLGKLETDNTYVVGIRANVWEYALRKQPDNAQWRKWLWTDAEWLLKAMNDHNAWRYGSQSRDWDNSCSQYGVLGIWAASRAGFDPGDEFWAKVSEHFRKVQNADGGWSYTTGGSTANMATAGLASMFLVFDMHHGKSFYSRNNPRAFKEGAAAAVLESLEKGMQWLGQNGGANNDGYYLYGIERTGVASGRKYIGGRDWFREGALAALKAQRTDGSIPTSRTPVIGTAFATLFMVYGGAPVAFNKLQYGPGQDWNLNPRDLANLTKHLWSAYEAPLNWHSVQIDAPVEEFEAPILFISGTEPAKFTQDQIAKLRSYVQRGGLILAEPTDEAPAFRKSMERLAETLFEGRKLVDLPADHTLLTAGGQTFKTAPKLRGVSDGSRVVFLLSDGYLSSRWQLNETIDDAFTFASGLLSYVTDRQQLPGKFSSDLPTSKAEPARDAVLTVARASVDGSVDAETGGQTWRRLSPYVTHRTGAKVKDLGEVQLTPEGLTGVKLLHLTGKRAFTLDARQRTALTAFVAGGGTVLVDAWAGNAGFAASARAELQTAFGEAERLDPSEPIVAGRYEGGVDLSREVRFTLPARRALHAAGQRARGQQLEVFRVDGRPAVLFSPLDLSAAAAGVTVFGAKGYRPASARRVITNVAGWLVKAG